LGFFVVYRSYVRSFSVSLLLLGLTVLPPKTLAQDVGIAAVVNDALISKADVDARVRLALLNSNGPTDPQARARLAQDVLHQLIDETLEAQEAKDQGITVDQSLIEGEYDTLERENKMPPGGLEQFLQQHGVSKQVLIDQLSDHYLWSSLVRGRYAPELEVGDDEVDAKIKEIKAHAHEPANRVAEIFLPVSDPSQDATVAAAAQRLVDEIKQGASFSDIARQFSQASSAATGGDLGWSAPGTLPADIQKIVDRMQPETMEGPVRLTGGYYILALIDRREGDSADSIRYTLTQAVFPLPPNVTEQQANLVVQKAREMTKDIRSCADLNALGAKISPELSGPIGDLTLSQMPAGLRPIVEKAHVAVPFDPLPVRGGVGIFMVCGRSGGETQIDRSAVESSIADQKFQNVSQRYLQELRRTAYIDIRN